LNDRSNDKHGEQEGKVGAPVSLDPVTLKAPSGRSSLEPFRETPWTRSISAAEPSPEPGSNRPDDDVIRGGAAADRDLDDILRREQNPRNRAGSLVADRYRLIREIGAGAAGSVYLAEDEERGDTVAIKVLHSELSVLPEMVARFEREALAASRIEHPNVAGATDFGRLEDGSCFLVLELIEGLSLSEVLAREGALSEKRALHVARQVAAGLAAAHRSGIIHRDLKPNNVMLVSGESGFDSVKVVDFGVAQVPAEEEAKLPRRERGNIFGTPEYMAPEQAAGTIVDHRADLYTLGIVLYEMLSGRAPFRGGDMHAVLEQQMTAEPAPLPRTVEPKIAALVTQLMAKDPDLRPPTAEEVCRRIDGITKPAAEGDSDASRDPTSTPDPTSALVSSRPEPGFGDGTDSTPASVKSSPLSSSALRMGGKEIPVWMLAVAAAVPLALVVTLVLTVARTSEPSSPPAPSEERLSADQLDALAHRASLGNTAALHRLEAHPPTTAAHWAAIGRGYSHAQAYERAVLAYARALDADPGLGDDEALLHDLRRATSDAAALDKVLQLATTSLGQHGPDLIYEVWTDAKSDPSRADLARKTRDLLHSQPVRDASTPALRIALDLWEAKSCAQYRGLLSQAQNFADRRSTPVLRTLTREEGCGEMQQEDCFACLRGDPGLELALESAEKRMPPRL